MQVGEPEHITQLRDMLCRVPDDLRRLRVRQQFDVERYVRDALSMPVIGGSSANQLNNIDKAAQRRSAR